MSNQIEKFLSDMSYNASFRMLDFGNSKDKEKLLEVAEANGLVMPSQDLAIFECLYAFTDRQNKNGCTLPKAEVEKALKTLKGKSIDLDHFRKSVVGHWLEGKLDGDKIIAYGAIFKGSFHEDFDVIKELFNKGNLAVSFEAWGQRVPNKTGYDLTDIEFAGGALLLKSEPAFDGAGVLELAKSKVLEFAKVMTAPNEFIREQGTDKDLEEARFYVHDMQGIMRNLGEVNCPSCEEQGMMDPLMIDYQHNKAKTKCINCGGEAMVDLTPPATLTKKGRKIQKMTAIAQSKAISDYASYIKEFEGVDDRLGMLLEQSLDKAPRLDIANRIDLTDNDFAIVKSIEVEQGKNRKIRVLPIHDLAHLNYAQELISTPAISEFLQQLEISKDTVERKLSRRIMTEAMEKLFKKYNKNTVQEVIQEVAKVTVGRELSKDELEKAQLSVTNLQTLKKGPGGASDQALNKLGDVKDGTANSNKGFPGEANSNETSLQTAEITEEQLKTAVTDVTKIATAKVVEDAKVAELQKKLDEANAKLAEIEKAKEAEEAKKRAELVKARREELTEEFAKDLKDEDLLDEAKFKIAQLTKENAELKKGGAVKPAPKTPDLSKGSKDKNTQDAEAESRSRIREMAFGSEKESEETSD